MTRTERTKTKSFFNAWQLQGYNAEQIDLIHKAAASGDYGDDPSLEDIKADYSFELNQLA